jgi:hypothetical protein
MQIVRNRKFLLLLISLVSICVLGICVSAIVSSFGSNSIKASKQSDYPIIPILGLLLHSSILIVLRCLRSILI